MRIFGFKTKRTTEEAIAVSVEDVSPVKKSISYSELFSHGLPMELFFRQVTRPYENIASVYKAIKALCDNVPQASLQIYNKNTEEEVEDAGLKMLLENPNKNQSQNDFIQEWVGFYALYGEGFIKKVQSLGQIAGIARALPAQLICLDPSKVKEQVDTAVNELIAWRYGTLILKPEEVVHTKDFNPYNRFRGMSPLRPIDDEMEIDQSSLTFNNAFFKNNATMGTVFGTDNNLTTEQKEALKKALEAKYSGSGGANAFKTLVLEKGLKPLDVGQHTHKEMEFIEQKRLMREEILGIWRTPKALFNITEDLNYATFMGQMRIFWLYALMPIMKKFEDSINKHIVMPYNPNLYIAFDYRNTPAFQQDYMERVQIGEILSRLLFTSNEINEMLELGFDRVDWRDKAYQPFSQQVVTGEEAPEPEAEINPEETPPATEEEPKGIKFDVRKAQFLKIFLKGQGAIEKKMESKFSRYLMELRAKILKTPEKDLIGISLGIDWEEQDDKLVKAFKPITLEGIKQGIAIGESVIGRKKSVDDELEHRTNSLLQIRMDKLTGINDRIKDRLQNTLRTTLNEQINAGASAGVQADALRETVRDFFNLTASRALLVARTESAGAVNGGSMLYYESEGVAKKEWITAHDELVRPTHRACEMQGAIPMDRTFVNGLMFPSDQSNGDAGEVCNCRCSLMPIVD